VLADKFKNLYMKEECFIIIKIVSCTMHKYSSDIGIYILNSIKNFFKLILNHKRGAKLRNKKQKEH
jgi:hypothetical protein